MTKMLLLLNDIEVMVEILVICSARNPISNYTFVQQLYFYCNIRNNYSGKQSGDFLNNFRLLHSCISITTKKYEVRINAHTVY